MSVSLAMRLSQHSLDESKFNDHTTLACHAKELNHKFNFDDIGYTHTKKMIKNVELERSLKC